MSAHVLVAGIGNIFLGDDGFGVEVAQRLRRRAPRRGVRVEDFGIRGVHLAYELLDGYDALVLVDAMPMGMQAGTVAVMEIDQEPVTAPEHIAPVVEAHSMDPVAMLNVVAGLGGSIERVVVVGCEPASVDEGIGLSAPVAGAVDHAIGAIESLLDELCPHDARTETRETCP